VKRKPKAIFPHQTLIGLLNSVAEGDSALRAIAIKTGLQSDNTIAKQSLHERISQPEAVEFFKQSAAEAFEANLTSLCPTPLEKLPDVNRILVGDSSAVKLHPSLREAFPGGVNWNRKSALLRLQCTLDLLTGQWINGGFDPYLRQDATAAHDLAEAELLQKGDLLIRDLGYAILDSFAAIEDAGAYFLSRLHPQWNLYPAEAGAEGEADIPLDLIALLGRKAARCGESFRMKVKVGSRQRFACELIAIRVPEAVAATRRRRAKENVRTKGTTYSKAYLARLDWTLLITNLPESSATSEQLFDLYGLRWRVEIFFKLCKSHASLEKIAAHRTNRYHAEVLLWVWLILMIGLSARGVFAMASVQMVDGAKTGGPPGGPPLARVMILSRSQIQMMPMVLKIVVHQLQPRASTQKLFEQITRQCNYHNHYEKRKDRISLPQRLESVLS